MAEVNDSDENIYDLREDSVTEDSSIEDPSIEDPSAEDPDPNEQLGKVLTFFKIAVFAT